MNKKTKIWLVTLLIAGFLIRLLAARDLGISADDANHALRGIGFISPGGKLVEYGQSSGLFYVLLDVIYRIFGTSLISSRLIAAFFGSLFIVLIFLFIKQMFKSEKAGLIGAALTAVSPFLIKNTLPEQDMTVLFFIIFSAYFLYKFIDERKTWFIISSATLIGVAILIKVYALFFLFSFIILLFIYARKDWKKIILFLGIALIFCLPTLTHNYLLYKSNGFADMMFTNTFKIGLDKAEKLYGWSAGYLPYTDYKGFFLGNQKNWQDNPGTLYKLPGFILLYILLLIEDPLIMIFGLIGFFLLFKKEYRRYLLFFIVSFPLIYIFIGAGIPMLKHLLFVVVLFIPMTSLSLEKIFNKINIKYLLIGIIIIGLLWAGKGIGNMTAHVYTQSAESQLMSFKNNQIPTNSIVLIDSRIYRGYLAWLFNDRQYLEMNNAGLIGQVNNAGEERININLYMIECVTDDCGWGTVKNQPEFNESMEAIISTIKPNSKLLSEIVEVNRKSFYFPLFPSVERTTKYKIYKTTISVNPIIFEYIKKMRVHLLYPIGFDRSIYPIFDDYTTHTFYDKGLDIFAHTILYSSILLVFGSVILLIYIYRKQDKEDLLANSDSNLNFNKEV